ncbi:flippase-like domain-containing protein [Candidatus Woesearchaeota archaeon]|nr:flippase-like domain-containing protein [Candidatus Woesearchaeota archaeon]
MKKHWTVATVVISVLIGIAIVAKVFQEIPLLNVINSFQHGNSLAMWGFILASISIMLLHTWRWHLIIKTAQIKISFWKTFLYRIVGFGISFITPVAKVGGEPLRAMLLQRQGATFRRGFSTVAIDKIAELAITGVLFVFGIIIALLTLALPENLVIGMVILVVIMIVLLTWFYFLIISDKNLILGLFRFLRLNRIKKLQKWEENIIEMDGWMIAFRKDHKVVFNKIMFITTAAWLLMFIEYKSVLMIFGIGEISFAGLFLIITVLGFAYLIPIPLALGVLEAAQISVFAMLRLNVAAGVALSIVIRARDFLWTLIGVGILSIYGFNIRKAYMNSLEQGGIKKPKERI